MGRGVQVFVSLHQVHGQVTHKALRPTAACQLCLHESCVLQLDLMSAEGRATGGTCSYQTRPERGRASLQQNAQQGRSQAVLEWTDNRSIFKHCRDETRWHDCTVMIPAHSQDSSPLNDSMQR